MLARLPWLVTWDAILSGSSPAWLGVVAMLAVLSFMPAEAKTREKTVTTPPIVDIPNGQPLTIVISLNAQKVDVYRGTTLVASSKVSSGKPGYATPVGVYGILEKRRWHESNIYSGAPMPWMQRLTWSGMALHGGVVPGYPASHGCVRLYSSFASQLFQITNGGENVVIARDRPAPVIIEHRTLFQPLPRTLASKPNVNHENGARGPSGSAAAVSLAVAEDVPHDRTESRESTAASKGKSVDAGIEAAAIQAAEPRSTAPLRILVTRQTRQDRIIGLQNVFASLGYLKHQNFDGTIGKLTVAAIKTFQKAHGLDETGVFTDDLERQVYAAVKSEPPAGHVFVRQGFERVFDTPATFKNPELPLGIQVYTALKFAPRHSTTQWMAVTVEGGDAASTLDRIEFPDEVRQKIEERLTPGSTLIIADTSINSVSLPKGGDFLVVAKDTAKVAKGIIRASRPRPRRHYYPPWFPFQPGVGRW